MKRKYEPETNIRAERVRRGLTQKDMSRLLGISENAYSFKETGKREFTLDEFRIICNHFECNPSSLLSGY